MRIGINDLNEGNALENLENSKNSLPVNFTARNIARLQSAFVNYQLLIADLPEAVAEIKEHCKQRFGLIRGEIEAASSRLSSWRKAKLHFKNAVSFLKEDLEEAIRIIRAKAQGTG